MFSIMFKMVGADGYTCALRLLFLVNQAFLQFYLMKKIKIYHADKFAAFHSEGDLFLNFAPRCRCKRKNIWM